MQSVRQNFSATRLFTHLDNPLASTCLTILLPGGRGRKLLRQTLTPSRTRPGPAGAQPNLALHSSQTIVFPAENSFAVLFSPGVFARLAIWKYRNRARIVVRF